MMKVRFQKAMEQFALPRGCVLTVALSGGSDSVALLHLLKELPERTFSLQAAHIEHGIRGEASRRDLEFCRALCEDWEIPLHIFEGDAPALAKEQGMSLEEAARALRYGFLDSFADGQMRFCATAHHRRDREETFFINLYRGSGSSGLSGIKARRGGYLRPLLEWEKEEILSYCEAQGLPYVWDETNEDTSYLRNFLRHEILPRLNQRQEGNFSEGLAAAMRCLEAEDQALNQWAESVCTDETETLAALPDAVLKRVLDRRSGSVLSRLHFEQIADLIRQNPPSAQLQLPQGRYFRIEYGKCVFTVPQEAPEIAAVPDQPARWGEWEFLVHSEEINNAFTHFQLDCDKIKGNLTFRHKRDGDRFLPAKAGGGTSRLQKRLKNDRVPRTAREQLWVLCDEQGTLLWAEGYGAAKEFAPDENTKQVYTVKIGKN
ncbi:MAG: tRNA lysidine(34) synthetase TilS [Clostridia bacterium]|nr:tRNA lysidine(34) synthetase TilS [Clostridia bacterium]